MWKSPSRKIRKLSFAELSIIVPIRCRMWMENYRTKWQPENCDHIREIWRGVLCQLHVRMNVSKRVWLEQWLACISVTFVNCYSLEKNTLLVHILLFYQHRYDYVQILDHNKKQVGKKICGKKYDKLKIEVPGNTAYVVFLSDYEATEQGFTANFQAISAPKPPSKGSVLVRSLRVRWNRVHL